MEKRDGEEEELVEEIVFETGVENRDGLSGSWTSGSEARMLLTTVTEWEFSMLSSSASRE